MRSIHSLILGNLKKMLVAALGLAALLFVAYTYISFRQTEKQAVNFVMSHVVSIVEAAASSQSVAEIDKDMGRFAKAWKDTQDLDLRIDVFLDQKQVGHAGPLQPFGMWSSTAERTLDLASGQHLSILLQTDLTKTIYLAVFILLFFEAAIVAVFYVLMRSMRKSVQEITRPLEGTVSWLKEMAGNLPESADTQRGSVPSGIVEIEDLSKSIQTLAGEILSMERNLIQAGVERARVKFAEQVAHNVRGVIATLQLKVNGMANLSAKEKSDLLSCADTLRDISASLLAVKKTANEKKLAERRPAIHLFPLVQIAVSSKQSEAAGLCRISFDRAHEALSCFAGVASGDIQTVISNLIDNSLDAVSSGGLVSVTMRSLGDHVEIVVSDNGKGVPAHVLPRLTEENFTYGKKNGNGIGLFHAKELMDAVGGTIEIESQQGAGTRVRLKLPSAKADPALVTSVVVSPGTTLVCVDDDSLIHQMMDMKLRPVRPHLKDVVHLSSVAQFESWISENRHGAFGTRLYLFDYDLKDELMTGLGLIEEYGLALESVLVSGMASDTKVALEANRLGVRRLPKDFLDIVPFDVGRPSSGDGQSTKVI